MGCSLSSAASLASACNAQVQRVGPLLSASSHGSCKWAQLQGVWHPHQAALSCQSATSHQVACLQGAAGSLQGAGHIQLAVQVRQLPVQGRL